MNTTVSVKRVPSAAYEQAIEDAQVEGWSIDTRGDRVAVLSQAGGWGSLIGHLIVLFLTGWWTLGLGNLAYALFRHYTGRRELHVKVTDA
jgi:hypothetical protein